MYAQVASVRTRFFMVFPPFHRHPWQPSNPACAPVSVPYRTIKVDNDRPHAIDSGRTPAVLRRHRPSCAGARLCVAKISPAIWPKYLFCRAFGWTPATNSKAHFDAVDKDGIHYQIKGRRLTPANQSRELGAIRDIAGRHFNFLAGLLFDRSCDVILRAAIIPHAVVMKHARPAPRSNSHKFLLCDDIWDVPGVCDVTDKLTAAAHTLDQL
jgi:hypothetical protein